MATREQRAKIEADIVALVATIYTDEKRTPEQILAFDPDDLDEQDPAKLYTVLGERYGVEPDERDDNHGGFGGTIANTVDYIAKHWDGRTLNDVELDDDDDE